jgi:F-type H+-transporting ATPase subunit b
MDLLIPHTGTIIWMLIAFSIVFFLLKKFAWKPILTALKQREESIENALKSAELARQEMENLQADNAKIIEKAKRERDHILSEARNLKDDMINEAKLKASEEADKIVKNASEIIKGEKAAAIKEIKEQVATLSVSIAEKILQEKLSSDDEQKEIIDKYLRNIKVN